MANKNTKRKNTAQAKELAGKKKGNPDFKKLPEKRKTNPKNFELYKKFPGFRKEKKAVA